MREKKDQSAERMQYFQGLKEEFVDKLPELFIDNYEDYHKRLEDLNMALHMLNDSEDEDIEIYTYDEFCKHVIVIYNEFFDNHVDVDKLFLSAAEYESIKKQAKSDTNPEFEKLAKTALQIKLKRNIHFPLEKFLVTNLLKIKIPEEKFNLLYPLFEGNSVVFISKIIDKQKTKNKTDEQDNQIH